MEADEVEIIENEEKGMKLFVNGAEIKNVTEFSLVDVRGIDKWGKEVTIKIWAPEIEYKKGR
ncbi:MAG: hypothetical protein ACLSV2_08520 [Clostridium sp.]